jgi:integrase
MKLTPAIVRSAGIPSGKSEAIFFDDDLPGLGLRVRQAGSRSFIFQYKLGTQQRRMALGTATALNVSSVRKIAEKLYARVKLGEDPARDKADAKKQAAETFIVAANKFLEALKPRYRPRSLKEISRHLVGNADESGRVMTCHSRSLHELQLAKIDRRDIATVIVAVNNDSGAVTANRVRSSLNTFFTWCIKRGLVEHNPVIGTEDYEEHSRERVLTPAELRLIWTALDDDQYGSIVKLLALTGQRASEIGDLRRTEIHDDTIVLAGERTKNKRAHVVPLSPAALAIIEAQPLRGDRDLIFGKPGKGPFVGWSNCKERLDTRIAEANGGKPIGSWRVHDLRRSFSTYAGGGLPAHQLAKLPSRDKELAKGLGIEPHIVEAVLNHISGTKAGVAGTYNRSTYEEPKRKALEAWATHLQLIVADAPNVTPIRRTA